MARIEIDVPPELAARLQRYQGSCRAYSNAVLTKLSAIAVLRHARRRASRPT